VDLKAGRDKAVREGHPWVFSGAVERVEGPEGAPLAEVYDAGGRLLGVGFYSPRSQIRVRMVGGAEVAVGRELFAARLAAALELRRVVVPGETTGYRLVNAEGDWLPGWTVDRFGEVLVSQITVAGLEAVREEAYGALREVIPGGRVVQANAVPARRAEGLHVRPASEEIGEELEGEGGREGGDGGKAGEGAETGAVIAGEPPAETRFVESGLEFTADVAGGQKTGFYCDQRENRRLAERLAGGRAVLDLFAHSGAFGLYALRGGARQVTHVESSAKLIERGRRHYAANRERGLDESRVEWVRANVWEDLRQRTGSYDMVICDPPPLVRKRQDLAAAARAYKDLNRLALLRLAPGGLLLTFTCSGAVDAKLFRQILFAAAVEAGARVALLAQLGAGPDHPVAITHPQGEYLKGWLMAVQGRA
jgi:23S rRNA (cytosine1962-C5)-methyltransferase